MPDEKNTTPTLSAPIADLIDPEMMKAFTAFQAASVAAPPVAAPVAAPVAVAPEVLVGNHFDVALGRLTDAITDVVAEQRKANVKILAEAQKASCFLEASITGQKAVKSEDGTWGLEDKTVWEQVVDVAPAAGMVIGGTVIGIGLYEGGRATYAHFADSEDDLTI